MRKYFLFIAVLGLLITSCEEEVVPTYLDLNGDTNKGAGLNNVYFSFPTDTWDEAVDSTFVNLKESDRFDYAEEMIVSLPIRVMGQVVDYDRTVRATLNKMFSTAGEEYVQFLESESVIPAGKTSGSLKVKLLNSEALMEKDTLLAVFELVDNENFTVDYDRYNFEKDKISSLYYKVFFYSTLSVPPRVWDDMAPLNLTASPGFPGADGSEGWKFDMSGGMGMYMGEFTGEKINILLAATGLELDDFEFTDEEALEMGVTTTNKFNRAKGVFEKRFGPTSVIFDRWKMLVKYHLSITEPYNDSDHPDYKKVLWGHNTVPMPGYPSLPAWGYLN